MIKIGFLANGEMLAWEPEKLCSFIKEQGYDAVELIGDVIFSADKPEDYLKRTIAAARQNGLEISEILAQQDLVSKDIGSVDKNVQTIISNIKKSADMGVKTVNLFTGPIPWLPNALRVGLDISHSEAWGCVFYAFDKILPVAEQFGVRLAVENVWGMLAHDFYTNKYLNGNYNSPNLGVNLDISHDALYGILDAKFLVEGWGKKIFHVHLKDAVGVAELNKFTFPLIGEGFVDFKELFSSLKTIGYSGVASVEFESWGYRQHYSSGKHADSAGLMRKVLEEFR